MSTILIVNGTIVTMDFLNVIEKGSIIIDDTRIETVSGSLEPMDLEVDETIDATGMIVMPGNVDSHFHTCQQLMRGMSVKIKPLLYPFWKHYLIPFESLLTPEDAYLSGLAAYTNMVRVGTTCFSEHGGRWPQELVRAAEEVGVRGLMAISTMDQDVGLPKLPENMLFSTEEAIEKNLEVMTTWPFESDFLVRGTGSLRQILVCTPDLIQKMTQLAREHGTMVQTHANEGQYEIYYSLEQRGLRPAEYMNDLGALNKNVIAAHSVLMSDEEVSLFARSQVGVAHCPLGNFQLGMTKLPLMRDLEMKVGLGSDGGSRGSIDPYEAMKVSMAGQQLAFGAPIMDREVVTPYDMVYMSTMGGARVCGLEDEIGSLRSGKRADVILLRPGINALPITDPYYTIANSLSGSDVETVIINGQIVMRDKKILTVDEDVITKEVALRAPQLQTAFLDKFH